jgi:Zn-dependent protease with chaperone function
MRLLTVRDFKWMLSLMTVLMILLAAAEQAQAQDEDLITRWVATRMIITKKFSMPVVRFVDKEELNRIFTAGSKHYMARWTADHGASTAKNLMGVYLDKAVGLFDPKSRVIYVGSFLPDCQRDAVLAHEIAHYFQYIFGGPVVGEGFAAEALLMEREIEASAIERQYEKQFCDGQAVARRP